MIVDGYPRADLRYVDTPSTEVSIDIAAPPERVWPLVTDVELPSRFSNEFQGAVFWTGRPFWPSAAFVGRNYHR